MKKYDYLKELSDLYENIGNFKSNKDIIHEVKLILLKDNIDSPRFDVAQVVFEQNKDLLDLIVYAGYEHILEGSYRDIKDSGFNSALIKVVCFTYNAFVKESDLAIKVAKSVFGDFFENFERIYFQEMKFLHAKNGSDHKYISHIRSCYIHSDYADKINSILDEIEKENELGE